MPRYYFHIRNPDGGIVADEEGHACEDVVVARREAVASIRDLVANAVRSGTRAAGLSIEITDEAGNKIDSVSAWEVFE